MTNTTQLAALTKRLKELLTRQAECYRRLIGVLEKQQVVIKSGSEESINAHVALGEHIIAEINAIQKTIDPLETMCHADSSPESEVLAMKAELEALNNRALAQSEQNRARLAQRMAAVRSEINVLENNPLAMNARRSRYASAGTPSLIDIRG